MNERPPPNAAVMRQQYGICNISGVVSTNRFALPGPTWRFPGGVIAVVRRGPTKSRDSRARSARAVGSAERAPFVRKEPRSAVAWVNALQASRVFRPTRLGSTTTSPTRLPDAPPPAASPAHEDPMAALPGATQNSRFPGAQRTCMATIFFVSRGCGAQRASQRRCVRRGRGCRCERVRAANRPRGARASITAMAATNDTLVSPL